MEWVVQKTKEVRSPERRALSEGLKEKLQIEINQERFGGGERN